ncbi:MAG: YbaK/EbsC family protein [Candidatus Limnocylindria bacterium]|nr:MAG: aminoacyl-tRNA deacylase [Chloroflexota bacterium]
MESHPNLTRVTQAAGELGVSIRVERFPEGTRTAQEAARAVGCDVGQIVKSLVFVADGTPVVALVSGADRLDTARLASVLGARDVRRATGDEVRAATGFAIGGVPPLGHDWPLRVVIDRRLLQHAQVWAAAGLPDAVFKVDPRALTRAIGATEAEIALVGGS